MLNKIRGNHIKIIFTALLILIIPAFVLWGGASFFKGRNTNIVGEIGNKKITIPDLTFYYKMAYVHFSLFEPQKNKDTKSNIPASPEDIATKAWEYVLLIWKANKEKIKVSDQEVMFMIKLMFFPKDKFDAILYKRFIETKLRPIQVTPRLFEEFVRNFIKVDKLFAKKLDLKIEDEEIKQLYLRDTQKSEIEYIYFPYENYFKKAAISEEEINKYYEENKEQFIQPAKAKMKYIVFDDNKTTQEILNNPENTKTIENISKILSVPIKETPFFSLNDPIEGLGWQKEINQIVFSLEKGKISPAIPLDNSSGIAITLDPNQTEQEQPQQTKQLIVFSKSEEISENTPKRDQVKDQIEEIILRQKANEETFNAAKALLTQLSSTEKPDLNKIARTNNLDYKMTAEFSYYDYIEGMGLNRQVSNIIFSLKEGQIYQEPVMLDRGAYIIRLTKLSPFNPEDFKSKKNKYYSTLYEERFYIERFKFMNELEREANLKTYTTTEPEEPSPEPPL